MVVTLMVIFGIVLLEGYCMCKGHGCHAWGQ